MFISMMFAGHHTTSGTAAWTLIELLRHPGELGPCAPSWTSLYAGGEEVSYQALREMPRLESAIKEALRLHPPLILLLRVAKEDLEVGGFTVRAGQMVGASPSVSNRIPEDFPDADSFVPGRYLEPREEDRTNPWTWIPFGAGRHRCVGAAFAMMQLKAIFSVLLLGWDFELAQPSDSYRNDHSKMVVQLQQPCAVRYRPPGRPAGRLMQVSVDLDLCQGHGVCESEAPAVFELGKNLPGDRARRPARPGDASHGRGRRPVLSHLRHPDHRQGVSPCPRIPAQELEEMMQRWLDLNRRCEERLRLATDGGHVHRGRHLRMEHRARTTSSWPSVGTRSASSPSGLEMVGLGGWTYPYQRVLIDDVQGEILGLWKQIADATRPGRHAL